MTEEDFKPQRVKIKRGSTSGQTWERNVGQKWASSQYQSVGQQRTHEEHSLFFADSSGNDQGAREFSKEAGLLSVQKAPELGQTAECGGEQLGAEDPTRTNLEEITAGHPHPPSL